MRDALLRQRAELLGLGKAKWWSVYHLEKLAAAEPRKGNAVAEMIDVLRAEGERERAMQAARAREYRARKAAARIEADERTCGVCGASIKGKRADAKFCSTKCRVANDRRRGDLRWLAMEEARRPR